MNGNCENVSKSNSNACGVVVKDVKWNTNKMVCTYMYKKKKNKKRTIRFAKRNMKVKFRVEKISITWEDRLYAYVKERN